LVTRGNRIIASIIIHVGFPKSASTLLQRGVFPKLDKLDFFPPRADSEIYRALSLIDYPGGETARIGVIRDFASKARASEKPALFSAEHFVMPGNCLATQVPKPVLLLDSSQILSLLQKMGEQVRILLVIRRQQDWLESWYQERIKRYETRTFQDMLKAPDFAQTLQLPRYDLVASDLMERFGEKNVFVVPFEFLRSDSERFFGAIGNAIGVPIPKLHLPVMKGRIKPITLVARRNINKLLVAVSRVTGGQSAFDQVLYRMLKKIYAYDFLLGRRPSGKYNFGPLPDEVIKMYARSNRELESITGLNLKDIGYF